MFRSKAKRARKAVRVQRSIDKCRENFLIKEIDDIERRMFLEIVENS